MMATAWKILPLTAVLLLTPAATAAADWLLDGEASALHFVSVKKGKVGEVHTFRKLEGALSGMGAAVVQVDLASVDTAVEIRDERMREMLFETGKFPQATVTAKVDPGLLNTLKPGERKVVPLKFALKMHGGVKEYEAPVVVTGLKDGALAVTSRRPVVVNAADFGMERGVEALRKVVDLPSIAHAVPVTFDLVFRPATK